MGHEHVIDNIRYEEYCEIIHEIREWPGVLLTVLRLAQSLGGSSDQGSRVRSSL